MNPIKFDLETRTIVCHFFDITITSDDINYLVYISKGLHDEYIINKRDDTKDIVIYRISLNTITMELSISVCIDLSESIPVGLWESGHTTNNIRYLVISFASAMLEALSPEVDRIKNRILENLKGRTK